MSQRASCSQCRQETDVGRADHYWYFLEHQGVQYCFCSKSHLLDWLKQGKDGVTICEPYRPTPEDEERMRQ
jgi:hypothetical protein